MRREGALYAVDGTSARDIWAVGAHGLDSASINDVDGLVMHWNGRRWNAMRAVYRDDTGAGYEAEDGFAAVAAVSASQAWATHDGVATGDVQRWNGRRWSLVKKFGGPNSILAGVAALSQADVWVVGPTTYIPERQHPLIAHWDGRAWRRLHPPLVRLRAALARISALSPHDIWAVGNRLIARNSC